MAGSNRISKRVNAYHRGRDDRRPVVWFEVEDFLRYFDHFPNPTGSQRVPFEVFVEAARRYGHHGRVRFCRLSVYTKQLIPIDFDAIKSAYYNPPGSKAPWKAVWEPARLATDFGSMWPVIVRNPIFFLRLAKTAALDLVRLALRPRQFEHAARPGDIVVTLGACWGVPDYGRHIAAAKARHGVRFAVLVNDMIPIENDEFVEPQHARLFRAWLADMVAHADAILTISAYSRRALFDFARASGWMMPAVEVIRLAGAWSPRQLASRSGKAGRSGDSKVHFPPRYVLFVSTIEIRKNHRLLVRVWRRLIERHGTQAVPLLIFAGQIGWMVGDLLADLAASGYLGGKIEHRPGLSDAELDVAYHGCLFTIFPSLCEGWGLPVAESLAHGKFCLASNRTSIPEVGGDLIDYFDPADDDDVVAKVERALFEPGYLAAREARVQAQYRATTWADCAHSVMLKLAPQIATASAAPAGDPHEPLASPQPVGNS